MKKIAVIMAGGAGERFWPLSRIKQPKQLLNLSSLDRNMLQEAVDRIVDLFDLEDIFIITSKVLQKPIKQALPELPMQNIIAEPAKRNTAPCLALATSYILAKYGEQHANNIVVSVLTADQLIQPKEKFIQIIEQLNNFCLHQNTIATIGIIPNRAETGFGYIEFNNDLKNDNIYEAIKFHEKPDHSRALEYIQKGNFLWNSGMFFYRLDYFVNQMIKHLPEVGSKIDIMSKKYSNNVSLNFEGANPELQEIFESMPDISIDYGLMERTDRVSIIKSNFIWDDLGSWDSLFRAKKTDKDGNIIEGNVEVINVTNSIIINKASKKFISTAAGLDGFVIINTDDSLMVLKIEDVQDVKKIVNLIKSTNKLEWL
ncbi:MAG TPA: sugar phosphate nucleotidyltransferase [Candidatus Kapabacteria bacterium]|nr:sugar phosphate nucleotidyltransferase [Candidatus Kapabacteria bacterium]